MKDEVSLSLSYRKSIRNAKIACRVLNDLLHDLQKTNDIKTLMPKIREESNNIIKSIHEANAYHNALNSD